jgi:hypothetical protein
MIDVYGRHTYDTADTDHGTLTIVTPSDSTIHSAFTAQVTGSVKGRPSRSFAEEAASLFAP